MFRNKVKMSDKIEVTLQKGKSEFLDDAEALIVNRIGEVKPGQAEAICRLIGEMMVMDQDAIAEKLAMHWKYEKSQAG